MNSLFSSIRRALPALLLIPFPLCAATTVSQVWYTVNGGTVGVFHVGVDGSNPVTMQSNISNSNLSPTCVAVDPAHGKYFYSDGTYATPLICSGNINLPSGLPTTIYTGPNSGFASIDKVAVDTNSLRVYFTQIDVSSDTAIYRLNSESVTTATQINTGSSIQGPMGLALDLPDNLVFSTDIGTGNLYVCNLAASTPVSIFNEAGPPSAYMLDLDPVNHLIYLTTSPDVTGAGNDIVKLSYAVVGSGSSASATVTASTNLYTNAAAGVPVDVALDKTGGFLYLLDGNSNSITKGSVTGSPAISNVYNTTGSALFNTLCLEAAPVVTTSNAAVTYTESGSAVTLDASASVTDETSAQIASATVSITSGFFPGDTLLAGTGGTSITTSYNSSTGALTLTGPDTLAHFKQVLQSVTYSSSSMNARNYGSNPTRTLSLTASDGLITSNTGSDSVTIPDTAPAVIAGASVSYLAGGSAVVLDPVLSVSDPDNITFSSATVKITSGFLAGDSLNFTNQSGITGSYNASTGILTLSGLTTLPNYQTALRSISYSSSFGDPTNGGTDNSRTLSWTVNDGTLDSNTAGSSLTVLKPTPTPTPTTSVTPTPTATDTAPTITAGASVSYLAGGFAVVLDPVLTVSDPDNTSLASATVAVTSGFLPGDILNFTNQGGITGSYNSSTGVLSLSGLASLANYQTALQSISYSFSASDPTNGGTDNSRTISWTANDGTLNGNPAGSSLTILKPTPTPTPTGSPSNTPTDTNTPAATSTPTLSATPTLSSTPTLTATPTDSMTPSATASQTPTASFTATGTASLTSSPTATLTVTFTPTITFTPTVTFTPTITPTPTVTPVYNASPGGSLVLGPNILTGGRSAGLFFAKPPQASSWKVYSLSGELVDQFNVAGTTGHTWNPAKLSSGLYLVRVDVAYQDGTTQDKTFKVIVLH